MTPRLEDYEIEILKQLAEDNGEVYTGIDSDTLNSNTLNSNTLNSNILNYYLKFGENFKKMVNCHGYECSRSKQF